MAHWPPLAASWILFKLHTQRVDFLLQKVIRLSAFRHQTSVLEKWCIKLYIDSYIYRCHIGRNSSVGKVFGREIQGGNRGARAIAASTACWI